MSIYEAKFSRVNNHMNFQKSSKIDHYYQKMENVKGPYINDVTYRVSTKEWSPYNDRIRVFFNFDSVYGISLHRTNLY